MISPQKHKERHQELHEALDELVADWISHTEQLPSEATVLDLMEWSASQVRCPTPNA